jgi:predicted NBD/HSP70 family sugar kinase
MDAITTERGTKRRSRPRPGAAGAPARATPDRLSLAAVLDLVRRGEATRQEIEAATMLGRAVVAERLATLARLGLLAEGARRRSLGGRAPRAVRLNADAGCILVATIDRMTLGVGLADVSGRLQFEHHEAVDVGDDPEPILGRLKTLFDWALEQQERKRPLWGIGVGVPSVAQSRNGPTAAAEHLGITSAWTQSRALERLVARHRVPVFVRSAIQMATMGEFGLSPPEASEDMLFIDLGSEINAGLISGGRVHRGALGIAGQLGHVAAADGAGRICRCGNMGCLETVAGAEALVRDAMAAAAEGRSRRLADLLAGGEPIGIADLGVAAQLGDAAAADLLARAGRAVGTAVAALANALNPARIVLGGEVAETGEILLAAIRETLYRQGHPLVTRDLEITRSRMGRSAGLAGTAFSVVAELFRPDFLSGWICEGTPLRHPLTRELLLLAEAAKAQEAVAAPAGAPPRSNAIGRREAAQ